MLQVTRSVWVLGKAKILLDKSAHLSLAMLSSWARVQPASPSIQSCRLPCASFE